MVLWNIDDDEGRSALPPTGFWFNVGVKLYFEYEISRVVSKHGSNSHWLG
jgi:hypothetical protein